MALPLCAWGLVKEVLIELIWLLIKAMGERYEGSPLVRVGVSKMKFCVGTESKF